MQDQTHVYQEAGAATTLTATRKKWCSYHTHSNQEEMVQLPHSQQPGRDGGATTLTATRKRWCSYHTHSNQEEMEELPHSQQPGRDGAATTLTATRKRWRSYHTHSNQLFSCNFHLCYTYLTLSYNSITCTCITTPLLTFVP